jgi:hypothetical protein
LRLLREGIPIPQAAIQARQGLQGNKKAVMETIVIAQVIALVSIAYSAHRMAGALVRIANNTERPSFSFKDAAKVIAKSMQKR